MLTQQYSHTLCLLARDYYTTDRKYLNINAGLGEIPTDIPIEALEVHIRDNRIDTIYENVFSNLSQCRVLNLFRNKISELKQGALNGLTALTYLTLKSNNLERLPVNIFSNLNNCSTLDLQDNYIRQVEPGAFNGLTALSILTFGNNSLE